MRKRRVSSKITALMRTRPCMIITTLHANGVVNAGTFGAYTNVGPAEIGIAIGMGSDTYRNIKRTGEFVINIPSVAHAAAFEVCGRNVPEDRSELDEAGLRTEPAVEVKAPLIAECVANIECRFWREMEIGHHSFVVGKAVCGHLAEEAQDRDGGLDPIKGRVAFGVRYPEPLYAVLDHVTRV